MEGEQVWQVSRKAQAGLGACMQPLLPSHRALQLPAKLAIRVLRPKTSARGAGL